MAGCAPSVQEVNQRHKFGGISRLREQGREHVRAEYNYLPPQSPCLLDRNVVVDALAIDEEDVALAQGQPTTDDCHPERASDVLPQKPKFPCELNFCCFSFASCACHSFHCNHICPCN